MDLQTNMDMEPGAFYEVGGGFLMPIKSLGHATPFVIDKVLPVQCMFDIYLAHSNGERVGFYFTTRFEVTNGGGYLLTTMHKKKATDAEVLIKTDELVVYNYPNRGTLAISPKVSQEIETIFDEQ